jgi:threonine dehydrogenase-like Zn-dependent dehydrogenase
MYGARDVRVENRKYPEILNETDAIIKLAAACVCGSDLWAYRGIEKLEAPTPYGHEYAGTVVAIGAAVKNIKIGDFVIGSFFASDNTCEICQAGLQTSCINRTAAAQDGAQSELLRVPLADGTLVATPTAPKPEHIPSLLASSDVLGTGWFGALAAKVEPGKTVAVVGDGAVGLLGVLAAKQMGADRIIAMSRHKFRQDLALEFGATEIVTTRGDEGVADIKKLTRGLGADSVIEAVGTQESMMQALRATKPGGNMGFVGVPHDVSFDGLELFFSHVQVLGGPAPVRQYLPHFIDLITRDVINPGKVFDYKVAFSDAAEGYKAMDERRAIKTYLEFEG